MVCFVGDCSLNRKSLKCWCFADYTTICNLRSFFSIMIWTFASEGLLRTYSNFFKNNLWKWIEPYSQDAPNIVLIGATNALPMAAPMPFAALLMTLPIGKMFILPTFHVHPRSWNSDSYFTCNSVKKTLLLALEKFMCYLHCSGVLPSMVSPPGDLDRSFGGPVTNKKIMSIGRSRFPISNEKSSSIHGGSLQMPAMVFFII